MTTEWVATLNVSTTDPTRAAVLDYVRELSRQAWPNPWVAVCQEPPEPAMVQQGPAEPSHGPPRPGAGTRVQPPRSNTEDLAATLLEFARAGQREDFDFLARASGVGDLEREELWTGTRRRLGLA